MLSCINQKPLYPVYALFLLGFIFFSFSYLHKHYTKNAEEAQQTEIQLKQYSLDNVNFIDKSLAHPYNEKLDKIATVTCISTILLAFVLCGLIPFINFLITKTGFFTLFLKMIVMAQCFFFSIGTYVLLKTMAGRIRPYMYFAQKSLKGIAEGDFNRSWPSGHSALTFTAVAFIICHLIARKDELAGKKIFSFIVLLSGILTAALRIFSGNHFLTDVLSGAFIGFSISTVVFFINERQLKKI